MGRAQVISAYQYFQPYNDPDEDIGYVETTNIEAIIPPTLPPGIKFDIISAIIRLLNLKDMFVGLPTGDENM